MEQAKILIIDDLQENLYAMEHLLADMKLDCQVVKAQSGQQGLNYIHEQEFALVLLDIMMPGMDGYEVAKRIREMQHRNDLPVIFITADTNPKPLDKFMAAGVVGSLQKPVNPEELQRKVKLFLNIYKQRQRR
jgi:CheY-like chemotaxis protein